MTDLQGSPARPRMTGTPLGIRDGSRSPDRCTAGRDSGTLPIQDECCSPARNEVAHPRREAEARRPQTDGCTRGRIPRSATAPVAAPSGARHLANDALRLESAQPAELSRAVAGIRRRMRSARIPARPLLGPGKPHSSRGRSAGRGEPRAWPAGSRGADRARIEPDDGTQGESVRGSVPQSRPAHAVRGGARGGVRAGQLPRARATSRRAGRHRAWRRVQLGSPPRNRTTARSSCANVALVRWLETRTRSVAASHHTAGCSRYLCSSSLPMWLRCTSSGPSARRRVRACAYA